MKCHKTSKFLRRSYLSQNPPGERPCFVTSMCTQYDWGHYSLGLRMLSSMRQISDGICAHCAICLIAVLLGQWWARH